MDTAKVRYHVGFWRGEYVRRATRTLAGHLSPKANQELVRALEIAGQPMEIDLSNPDPRVASFVHETHTLSDDMSLEIPAEGQHLLEDGHWWPAVRVHRLRGAQLDVDTGLVFCDGRVATQSGSGHRWSRDAAFISGAYKRATAGGRRHIEGAAAPLGQCNNFYHFLIETLPRVLRVQEVSSGVRFLTSTDVPEYASAMLSAVGAEVWRCEPGSVLMADDLWLCEPQPLYWPHPADLKLLSGLFGEGAERLSRRPFRRLYVFRSNSTRSLATEALLESEFMQRGFEVVRLEEHSPQQQAAMMRETCEVVAPHGAGLANIVFMPPGGSVVELTTGEWWWPCFRRIAHSRNLRHHLVLTQHVGDQDLVVREAMRYLEGT